MHRIQSDIPSEKHLHDIPSHNRRPGRHGRLANRRPLPAARSTATDIAIVSIVAFVSVWCKDQELTTISKLARETLDPRPPGPAILRPAGILRTAGLRLLGSICPECRSEFGNDRALVCVWA